MLKLLANIRAWIIGYRNYLKALNDLQRLNDRQLSDIGVSRCDIEKIASMPFNAKYH